MQQAREIGCEVARDLGVPLRDGPNYFPAEAVGQLCRQFDMQIVTEAVSIIRDVGSADEPRADTVKSLVQIMQMFPRWRERRGDLISALRAADLRQLRTAAKKVGLRAKHWSVMTSLMIERIASRMGPGR